MGGAAQAEDGGQQPQHGGGSRPSGISRQDAGSSRAAQAPLPQSHRSGRVHGAARSPNTGTSAGPGPRRDRELGEAWPPSVSGRRRAGGRSPSAANNGWETARKGTRRPVLQIGRAHVSTPVPNATLVV